MNQDYIMELNGVSFAYEDGTKALNNIDLGIRRGEKLAVLGANGSGKSTLFLCLNGINRPVSGVVNFKREPVSYRKKNLLILRSKVGIVFQEPDNQLFCADIIGELSFGLLNLGVTEAEAENRVNQVIRDFGLSQFSDKPTHFLSAGQKKMISIAEIVAMEPDIIILDEPFAALDPYHTKIVEGMIERLNEQGITVIQSTHDVDYAYSWAERILIMNHGEVAAVGTPEEIFMDGSLISSSKLEKPSIIQIYEKLLLLNKINTKDRIPKNLEELIQMI